MPLFNGREIDLYYEVQGEGAPLLFTHGASWNHKQWQPQVDDFSPKYKTIVWDIRGHGLSSLPDGKVDSEDFSRDLVDLLDHLDIGKATLCGLSLGGHISLQTAVRYPERVESLVLIGTPFTNAFNGFERMFVPLNRWSSYMMPMKLSGKIQGRMLSKFNKSNQAYIEEAFCSIPHSNWVRLWDAITRMESKHDLAKIQCPTLLLQGEHDTMIRRQQVYMQEKISNSRLQLIKNAHHATNLDNPLDVNEAIAAFLSLR
ncbi:alpha/beta hydrolase [Paenibacillus sp. JCM 10914]|uniref:alpha/beta fold hydrolase n=1 Tax=Paenibacillus sp. JCM 10914 TaxID=1236974 RepID=UPI0003CC969F|nr:alpha/beta hydrolase [Paenibacillus sp. JCM 10914]GAE07697.1 hydrolase [Paenibacillus sp. JCM 10914]